jgi:anaerobic magnesium-protoporphyrin IX monomethyl ester cyclase
MKICLISPYPDITAYGLRTISACLKQGGHETRMIFLPDPYGDDPKEGVDRYTRPVLDELVALCQGADVIGISLMTNFFDSAVQLTGRLKQELDAKVVWGGIHPTVCPMECLEHADMVCIGEGEGVMVQLADRIAHGARLDDIEGLWIRTDKTIIKNPVRPLETDLDVYPLPDYSLEGHYILSQGGIRPVTMPLIRRFLKKGTVSNHLGMIGYQTMTGRGCPHRCSYCVNDTLKGLYRGQRYLRWRSNAHVIKELSWARENFPFVQFIWISDDSFFSRPLKDLGEFAQAYQKEIGLPFSCLASPLTITEEKMALLINAGLCYVQMGIETGSEKIQRLFSRGSMSNDRMKEGIAILHRYREQMFPPSYDFIMDVPYETDEDRIATLKFISQIPKPYRLQPFSLVLYPGTGLYRRAKKDGYIRDEKRQIYAKSYSMREPSYLSLLVSLTKFGRFPAFLLSFLISKPVVRVLGSPIMRPFFRHLFLSLRGLYRAGKSVEAGS